MKNFGIPENPHDLFKKRLSAKEFIKDTTGTSYNSLRNQEVSKEKYTKNTGDSPLDSILNDIDSITKGEVDVSYVLEYIKQLNQEAKKYKLKTEGIRDDISRGIEFDSKTESVARELESLSSAYDKLITFKYKDYQKREDQDGVKHTITQAAIDESFLKIQEYRDSLKESDPYLYRAASILKDHQDYTSSHFVNTASRQEDYEWLLREYAKGSHAILLHGAPGTGKTEYVRHFAHNFLGEDPIELVGKPDMRTTELEGQIGLRQSKDNPNTVETYKLDGVYDKAKEQAKRLGKAVIHFDEIDITTPAVRMWFKPKYREMRDLGIVLIATGNMNAKSGRSRLDAAELREFSKKEVSYMPKEEFFDVCIAALSNDQGVILGDKKEIEDTLKNFTDAVSIIQRDFTKPIEGNQDPILRENVIDTGTALRLLSGFQGGSLHSHLSKEIDQALTNTPQTDPKDKKDISHIANIFATHNFRVSHTLPALDQKINETTQRLKDKNGYISIQELVTIDPYHTHGLENPSDKYKETRKDILGQRQESFEYGEDFESLLEQDYSIQLKVHQKAGFLENLSNGKQGIKGINGKEYSFPTIESLREAFFDQRELVEKKLRQYRNPKICITPIALPILDIALKYRKVIAIYKDKLHDRDGTKLASKNYDMDETKLENNSAAAWIWNTYQDNSSLVYDPVSFTQDSHSGKTKEELIATLGGYTITIREDAEIPREETKLEQEGRTPLAAGKSPNTYIETLKTDPQYQGESGSYIEEDILYAITKLIEEDGLVVANYENNTSTAMYSLGTYFPGSSGLPVLYWHASDRRAYVGGSDPRHVDSDSGALPLVRSSKILEP